MSSLKPHEWDLQSFEWPLTSRSVVWEVGGYEGRWAKEILNRYGCRMYVFEPQSWAYERLLTTLAEFPSARVFNFGLGERDAELPMGDYFTDGASFLKAGSGTRQMGNGILREIGTVKRELNVGPIDLMLVNVEGYEYTLIPHMLNSGILPRYLMYQGHPFDGWNDHELRARLARRYDSLWDYGLTLSAWQRRLTTKSQVRR